MVSEYERGTGWKKRLKKSKKRETKGKKKVEREIEGEEILKKTPILLKPLEWPGVTRVHQAI